MKAAAKLALQGTAEDIVEFLDVGQFVARNRDQEHTTIEQLIKQAESAGKQAEAAMEKAEEASDKAVAAAALAKEAAERAAKETQDAKNDAQRASVKAGQAADAARAAAGAAQQAIGAANEANRSARRAALAAVQTANAAAAAAEAAGRASNAAYAASKDKDKAQAAKDRAAEARKAGDLAKKSAKAAEQAAKASLAAADAAAASRSATTNANSAAAAADQAAEYAEAAGGSAAGARAAAAETRRHAAAANRAANAAEALARRSATAANEARAAADLAATHAYNAADAADDAAKHAGEAADQAAEAAKQAKAAKAAADAATEAVATAQTTYELARDIETQDLDTRTDAGVEAAMTMKAATDTFTVEVSKTVLEGQSIMDDTRALATEANAPEADRAALAGEGRAVALRAMKYFGSWRQAAAVRALSGTDADVIEYLRTGWDEAVAAETRQQVSDLASNSPYEAVRAAAAEALDGTDQEIQDFYTTGQHQVANADYRVAVTKLANDGGPSVKEGAKAALEDGSVQALLGFLNKGRYAAQQVDERVTATQLYNEGGPEVRSAAKIALAGSADDVHRFVQEGQYMAARKDELAATHIAQVQRLIAEGEKIAATARRNSALAAQAAAEAKGAADDAEKSEQAAEQSAKEAAGYAAAADAAADRAEDSAAQAKASAVTARAAADRANRDATAAEESAAQAEFSADYARTSAYEAQVASDRAHADAVAAGKSAKEADQDAAAAWKDVVAKREAEEAEARRLAEEKRKKERESKPKCYIPMNRDSLPPCAMAGGELVFPTIDPTIKEFAWEVLGLNDAKDCVKNPSLGKCTLAALGFLPVGKLKLLKKSVEGVEGAIDSSRAARMAQDCVKCFLAGTGVLMADDSVKDIEAVQVGDEVLATDPVTQETGPRKVTDLIVTEGDKYFVELSISTPQGEEKLTATEEHPFWSPSEDEWVEAWELAPGMTLRTDDGDTVTIRANRFYGQSARTYNLTVEGLHSYYVLAGDTPVLVHNSRCLIGNILGPKGETLWLPKGRKAVAVTDNGKGWVYEIKESEALANGLDKKVRYVRVMDPVTKGNYQYPNGYVIYMNGSGQTMNPITGQVGIPKSDPYNHIPIP